MNRIFYQDVVSIYSTPPGLVIHVFDRCYSY